MAFIEAREGKVYYDGYEVVKIKIYDGDPEDEEAGEFYVEVWKSAGLDEFRQDIKVTSEIQIDHEDMGRLSILGIPVQAV